MMGCLKGVLVVDTEVLPLEAVNFSAQFTSAVGVMRSLKLYQMASCPHRQPAFRTEESALFQPGMSGEVTRVGVVAFGAEVERATHQSGHSSGITRAQSFLRLLVDQQVERLGRLVVPASEVGARQHGHRREVIGAMICEVLRPCRAKSAEAIDGLLVSAAVDQVAVCVKNRLPPRPRADVRGIKGEDGRSGQRLVTPRFLRRGPFRYGRHQQLFRQSESADPVLRASGQKVTDDRATDLIQSRSPCLQNRQPSVA